MIRQKEIRAKSRSYKVPTYTVDKDWVLGHLLRELFNTDWANALLVFKGGTSLRKCYFENYRFSQDLDFTSTTRNVSIDEDKLLKICSLIQENVGIRFDKPEIESTRNGIQLKVRYWGANNKQNEAPPPVRQWPKVKMEISGNEIMAFPVEYRQIIHTYSDENLFKNNDVACYSISEILAEKLRALIERSYTSPRDYYDLWFIINNQPDLNWESIIKAFHKKLAFKGLNFNGCHDFFLERKIKILKSHWASQLGDHLDRACLPKVDQVVKELRNHCEKFFEQ